MLWLLYVFVPRIFYCLLSSFLFLAVCLVIITARNLQEEAARGEEGEAEEKQQEQPQPKPKPTLSTTPIQTKARTPRREEKERGRRERREKRDKRKKKRETLLRLKKRLILRAGMYVFSICLPLTSSLLSSLFFHTHHIIPQRKI